MSKEVIQQRFLFDTLDKNIKTVYRRQLEIYLDYVRKDDDRVKRPPEYLSAVENALRNPHTQISKAGDGFVASLTFPLFIRFMDMKKIANWKIYNKLVWGIIYRKTYNDISYGYSSHIAGLIKEGLVESFDV